MSNDNKASPVWMYRKGEGKLFNSADDVPDGEGWVDSPALVGTSSPTPEPEPEAASDNEQSEPEAGEAQAPVRRRGRRVKPAETAENGDSD